MSASPVVNSRVVTLLILHAIPICFASNVILGRTLNESVEPASLAFYRWSIAATILLLFSARKLWLFRAKLARAFDLLLLLGFMGMFVSGAVFYAALHQTTAIKASLIYMSSPLIILFIEVLFRGLRLSFIKTIGVLTALTGVIIVLVGDLDLSSDILRWQEGDILCVAAAISWAIYSVVLKSKRLEEIPTLVVFSAVAIVGSIILLPFYIWENGYSASLEFSGEIWLNILFIASVSSVLAFGFYQKGVALVGASTTSLYLYLLPVYTVLIAVLWLGETLSYAHIIGFFLIIPGLYLSTRKEVDHAQNIIENR